MKDDTIQAELGLHAEQESFCKFRVSFGRHCMYVATLLIVFSFMPVCTLENIVLGEQNGRSVV